MASPDPMGVRRIPARVCANPTDLSIDFPHGGTALGEVRAITFRPEVRTSFVTAEEYAGAVVEAVYAGEAAVLALALRDFDPAAIAAIFPNASTGLAGGPLIAQDVTGDSVRGGRLLSGRALKLYVSPNAIDADPGLYLPRACPYVEKTAALRWGWPEEWSTPVVFVALPDASMRCYRSGLRGDVVL